MKIRKIALFYNPKAGEGKLKSVSSALSGKKIRLTTVKAEPDKLRSVSADAAVSLGGDGTALYAVSCIAEKEIPLLAVNAGGLGFLSSMELGDFHRKLGDFLDGKFRMRKRMLLSVSLIREGRKILSGETALNDCVINSAGARSFVVSFSFAGRRLAEYFGDGLIVSSPTGSTAYNLSASGPILDPELDAFVITPICPHALSHRPVVLPAGKEIELSFDNRRNLRASMSLCLDGQKFVGLKTGDRVIVGRHRKRLRYLVPRDFSYFDVLRKKLGWGV